MGFIIFYLSVFIVSILFHELGHYIYLIYIKKNSKLNLFKLRVDCYDQLTLDQEMFSHGAGIFLGGVIIALSSYFSIVMLFLFIAYFYGCKNDFSELFKLDKKKNL
jgi:hypothetical protein